MTERAPIDRKVRINCLIRRIVNIDVVQQTFTAQFILSAKWEIDKLPDGWTIDNLKDKQIDGTQSKIEKSSILSVDGKHIWSPRLNFRNKIDDLKEEEIWWRIEKEGKNTMRVIYSISAIGVFQQQMKLNSFPVDSQQLSIMLLSRWEEKHKEYRVTLEKDLEQDSLVKIGKMKDEYVLNDESSKDAAFIEFNACKTDADESTNGLKYSYVSMSFILTRNPSYYFYNVWLPTFLFTSLSTFSLISKNEEILLAPFLATVSLLQYSSQKTPCISYLTLQDRYLICCIGFQIICGFILAVDRDNLDLLKIILNTVWSYFTWSYFTDFLRFYIQEYFTLEQENRDVTCTLKHFTQCKDLKFVLTLGTWFLISYGFKFYLDRKRKKDFSELNHVNKGEEDGYLWIRGDPDNVGKSAKEFIEKLEEAISGKDADDVFRKLVRPLRVAYLTKETATSRFASRGEKYETASGLPFFILAFKRASEATKWKFAIKNVSDLISSQNIGQNEKFCKFFDVKESTDEYKSTTEIQFLKNEFRKGIFGKPVNDLPVIEKPVNAISVKGRALKWAIGKPVNGMSVKGEDLQWAPFQRRSSNSRQLMYSQQRGSTISEINSDR
jgi:hypothetical protein